MVLAAGVWGLVASSTYSPVRAYADPGAQLKYMVRNPGAFAYVVIRNLVEPRFFFRYVAQYIGTVGHVDTPLPAWFHCLHALVLVGVASFSVSPGSRALGLRPRLLCLAVWLLIGLLISTIGYLTWTKVGDDWVIIQGRYFIPIGPLLFLCLCDIGRRFPQVLARVNRALPWCAVTYLPLSLCLVAWVLYERYYALK